MKFIFWLSLILFTARAYSQLNPCFLDAKMQQAADSQYFPDSLKVGDTISDDLILKMLDRTKRVVGCKFPYSAFLNCNDSIINTDKLMSDYVFVNFNYLYSPFCKEQLDEFIKIKKTKNKLVTVIALFKEDKKELKEIIDTYGNEIKIIPNANKWIDVYGLGVGLPLNYILDKNKTIIYAEAGTFPDIEQFRMSLLKVIK